MNAIFNMKILGSRFINMQLFVLMLLGLSISNCQQLSTEESLAPIIFEGIDEIQFSENGELILTWTEPEGIEILGYEVYFQDLSVASTGLSLTESGETTDFSEDSFSSAFIEVEDENSPIVGGSILTVVDGGLNNYKVDALQSGKYAIQLRAVAVDGRSDDNKKVALITIDSAPTYPGIASAELTDNGVLLTWPALQSNLKGEVSYTVYEDRAFNVPVKISSDTNLFVELRGRRPGTVLDFGVRAIDPKGRSDKNTKTIAITVPEESGAKDYQGCLTAEARGADRILLKFAWPEGDFERLKVIRNGIQVFETKDKGLDRYLDIGLSEGEAYEYTCIAQFKDLIINGTNILKLTTLASNAPRFKGIKDVKIQDVDIDGKKTWNANITWGVTSGVPNDKFKIYANPGQEVDFNLEPKMEVAPNLLEAVVENLGDDLTWTFGVRACSKFEDCGSGNSAECRVFEDCDSNIISLLGDTGDSGPPTTPGATAVKIENKVMTVTAPWSSENGGIHVRYLQIWENSDPGTSNNNPKFTETFLVENPAAPVSELTFDGVFEDTQYYIKVIDADKNQVGTDEKTGEPIFQKGNGNEIAITINSGDTSPPTFQGLTGHGFGQEGKEDSTIKLLFNAISYQGESDKKESKEGATDYVLFILEGEDGNACTDGAEHQAFPASLFPTENVDSRQYEAYATDLKEQTTYQLCLKARDKAGNISIQTENKTQSTQDITAPQFLGVSGLSYDKDIGKLVASWAPSTSSDVTSIRIRTWKNTDDPEDSDILNQPRIFIEPNQTSFEMDAETYNFASNDEVYVVIDLCDDADVVTGVSEPNCTDMPLTSNAKVQLDDIEPPQGFLGVKQDDMTATQDTVTVAWFEPDDWTGYAGFRVFLMERAEDGQLNYVNEAFIDCICTGLDCTGGNHISNCDYSGLDAYRKYTFYVRAFDNNPVTNAEEDRNYTLEGPEGYTAEIRTADTEAPVFTNANLSTPTSVEIDKEKKIELTWEAATDNQYVDPNETENPTLIYYELYRRIDSTITDPDIADPSSLGAGIIKVYDGPLTFAHDTPGATDDGKTYYYRVCARDMSDNRSCFATAKDYIIPDQVKPVIACFNSNRGQDSCGNTGDAIEGDSYFWDLAWTASDASDATNTLKSVLYIKYSQLPLNDTDTLPNTYDDRIDLGTDVAIYEDVVGRAAKNEYIHYLLVVSDPADNKATERHTEYAENAVEIDFVRSDEAPIVIDQLSNGFVKYLVIGGNGFKPGLTVWIGNQICSSPDVLSKKHIICRIPDSANGDTGNRNVRIVNPSDTGEAILLDALRYCDPSKSEGDPAYCSNICNRPSDWTGSHFAIGDGSTDDPFVLCNATHLYNVKAKINNRWVQHDKKHWAMRDNIFLGHASSFYPIGRSNGRFRGTFDGENHAVIDFKYEQDTHDAVGLFGYVGETSIVKNLGVLNALVKGRKCVGAVIGALGSHSCPHDYYGSSSEGKNLYGQGTVVGVDLYVGGVIGLSRSDTESIHFVGTVTGKGRVGGAVGKAYRETGNVSFSGDVTATSGYRVGGLFGYLNARSRVVADLYSEGTVTSPGGDHTGGLVGQLHNGGLANSKSKMVISSGANQVGGLIGHLSGAKANISDVTFEGTVNGKAYTGGIVGNADFTGSVTATNLLNTGNVNGHSRTGGLFGDVSTTDSGTIFKLKDSNNFGAVKRTGSDIYYAGLIATAQRTRIENSHNRGEVTGRRYSGGLVGNGSDVHITDSSNTKPISASGYERVGGIAGNCNGDRGCELINGVYNTGEINGGQYTGGLVGVLRGVIYDAYNSGKVTGERDTGGIAGHANTISQYVLPYLEIEFAHSTGDITGTDNVGGILGYAVKKTKISKVYSTGSVNGNASTGGIVGQLKGDESSITFAYANGRIDGATHSGGVVGYVEEADPADEMNISDVFATGEVLGHTNVGGLIGFLRSGESFSYGYSIGKVTKDGGENGIGGLIGNVASGKNDITNAFWDVGSSGLDNSDGGIGKTTEEMKTPGTWSAFNVSVWNITNDYPSLEFGEPQDID